MLFSYTHLFDDNSFKRFIIYYFTLLPFYLSQNSCPRMKWKLLPPFVRVPDWLVVT